MIKGDAERDTTWDFINTRPRLRTAAFGVFLGIDALLCGTSTLVSVGIAVSPTALEYTYDKLVKLRTQLMIWYDRDYVIKQMNDDMLALNTFVPYPMEKQVIEAMQLLNIFRVILQGFRENSGGIRFQLPNEIWFKIFEFLPHSSLNTQYRHNIYHYAFSPPMPEVRRDDFLSRVFLHAEDEQKSAGIVETVLTCNRNQTPMP